eukprot:10284032-Heterocapsa_arctica.AAC.1
MAEKLFKEIVGHDEDLAAWTSGVKAATKVREMERSDLRRDAQELLGVGRRARARDCGPEEVDF